MEGVNEERARREASTSRVWLHGTCVARSLDGKDLATWLADPWAWGPRGTGCYFQRRRGTSENHLNPIDDRITIGDHLWRGRIKVGTCRADRGQPASQPDNQPQARAHAESSSLGSTTKTSHVAETKAGGSYKWRFVPRSTNHSFTNYFYLAFCSTSR